MKRFIISFLLTLVIASVAYTVFEKVALPKNQPIQPTEAENESDKSKAEPSPKEEKKNFPRELFFVVLGVDGNGLDIEKGLRSDVIIVTRVMLESGEIKMLQVHRDSRVPVKGEMMKINAAHSYGGPDLAMKTIGDYLGVKLDYYVKIDFKGVMDIVDLVDGVDFDVPVDMNYDDPTAKPPLHIHLKKGMQHLDGKNSHDLLRFRHNNRTDYYPCDLTREQVQLMWLKEFAKTVLQPKNILKLPDLIRTGLNSVSTNIPVTTILSSATAIGNINIEKMDMQTIKGDGHKIKSGGWYWFNDEEDKKEKVDTLFGDYKLE